MKQLIFNVNSWNKILFVLICNEKSLKRLQTVTIRQKYVVKHKFDSL